MNEEIKRAGQAKEILENPLVVEAFDSIRNSLISQIEDGPTGNEQFRHEVMISLQLLKQVKHQFEVMIQTGELAEAGSL